MSDQVALLQTAVREMLESNPEVAKMAIRRLKKIGVTFPTWIHHPLVDYLRQKGIDND